MTTAPWQLYQPGTPFVPEGAQALCETIDWADWCDRCDARGIPPHGNPEVAYVCGRIEVGWLAALDVPVIRVTTLGLTFSASRRSWGSAN